MLKLTHCFRCHLNDIRFSGCVDGNGLDFGDDASFGEILSSFCVCGLFLDGHTFQTSDASLRMYRLEILHQLVLQLRVVLKTWHDIDLWENIFFL